MNGEQLRDEGMSRADRGAAVSWKRIARKAVRRLCKKRDEWTSDDVHRLLERWEVPPTKNMRALGPVILRASRAGWCVSTGKFSRSTRPSEHCCPVRIWRSLLRPTRGVPSPLSRHGRTALKRGGWTIVCESPLEVEKQRKGVTVGAASGTAVSLLVAALLAE